MKQLITLLSLMFAVLFADAQQNLLKSLSVHEKFTNGMSKDYTFYVSNASSIGTAKLVINGSDYDYDNDGDYTQFTVAINGTGLITTTPLEDKGMPGNGSYGDVSFQIGQYLLTGTNTITLTNTEISGQVDYTYIQHVKVYTDQQSGSSGAGLSLSLNSQKSISKHFTAGTEQSYNFDISNPGDYSSAKLVLRGSDYDKDNDGDYTDFRVQINGNSLIDIEPLQSKGMGGNGDFNEVEFDILSELKAGTNEILLENTEDPTQVDYTWLSWIKVLTQRQTVQAVKIYANQQSKLYKKFTAGAEWAGAVYVSNPSSSQPAMLEVNGSDYDQDHDGDYTQMTVSVNGTEIVTSTPLEGSGMPQNGKYGTVSWDISSYLRSGTNTIVLRNTETSDQTDYTYIQWVRLSTQATQQQVAQNEGPEIIITAPAMERGFRRTSDRSVAVKGKAIDKDGIYRVLVNGVEASLFTDGTFSATVTLQTGQNSILVKATDARQKTNSMTFNILQEGSGGPMTTGKRLALVIGNASYSHAGKLANPVNDAVAMEQTLSQLGFQVMKHENSDQRSMKQAIDQFGQKLPGYDVGLFFYAGHGIQVNGQNYLIPTDARLTSEQDVEYDCVRADRVLAKMEAAGTATNLVVLDACRNNPFERSWSRSANGQGLAFMNAPSGSLIAYATAPGTTASDGTGSNGLYTSAILRHIKVPNLTVEKLFKRVRATVIQESGGSQTPWESTSLTGDFYFKP